jgi:capsular exopolysaccharide synthesis family protein
LRTALTSLLVANQNGEGPCCIAVTSPGPGEGKTTVASNIAVLLAQMGQRTVLVDADARRPRVHDMFGISRRYGLGDLLAAAESPAHLAFDGDFTVPSGIHGLHVLPAGAELEGISDFSYGLLMPALLERLRTRFDFVIIDTPPVLLLPTARIVGRMADAVVLVIRFGHTTPEAAVRSASYLRNDGSSLLGTILNYWDPSSQYCGYSKGKDRDAKAAAS